MPTPKALESKLPSCCAAATVHSRWCGLQMARFRSLGPRYASLQQNAIRTIGTPRSRILRQHEQEYVAFVALGRMRARRREKIPPVLLLSFITLVLVRPTVGLQLSSPTCVLSKGRHSNVQGIFQYFGHLFVLTISSDDRLQVSVNSYT